MKLVVIGGTGLIGSKLTEQLRTRGYDAVPAAPNTGVNTLTGEGLADVLKNAAVVVDVSNAPSFEEKAVMEFFRTSTRNLLSHEAKAGVRHHVALSVVGADRLFGNAYIRAKIAQEQLIRESGIPYTIIRATQFFEFFATMAHEATIRGQVHLPAGYIQPIAADDVANAVGKVSVGTPLNGIIEVGGPACYQFADFVRQLLHARNDSREVIVDPDARYFGAKLNDLTLVASNGAMIGETHFEDWLSPAAPTR
ncbi:MAG: SDR family oxidoreductase [Bryobacteraceae bacterium]